VTEEDGKFCLSGVCIGTGVGDYAHYINRPTTENDLHGMGAFVLMCADTKEVILSKNACEQKTIASTNPFILRTLFCPGFFLFFSRLFPIFSFPLHSNFAGTKVIIASFDRNFH